MAAAAGSGIVPAGGGIAAEYFDIGTSRSLPWKRRPEASRLLDDLTDPDRGWDAVVIGEPARAFYGGQFALTFPVLTHYRVALWVPEVGGAVDPGSEAQDLVMTLFGGLSKGERTGIRLRVRTAMEALAADGNRFLGGRPPYGYRLVDAGPHPNPAKASAGQRLHRLEPDPVTAPVVQRIFTLYAAGDGLRDIAQGLTDEDIPFPAAYDPVRNRHRDLVAGRTPPCGPSSRTPSTPADGSGGSSAVMRSSWMSTTSLQATSQRCASSRRRTGSRGSGKDRPRSWTSPRWTRWRPASDRARSAPAPGRPTIRYLLRGLLWCGICGRRLQGSARRSRTPDGTTRILYRCELGGSRSVPRDMDHPSTVYVREDAITGPLDQWLAKIIKPEALAAAQAPPAPTWRDAATRAAIADCDLRIDRLLTSVEDGMPSEWIAARVVKLRAERDRLERMLPDRAADRPLSPGEIKALADALGGIVGVFERATPEDRAAVYRELNLRLAYDPTQRQVHAVVDLSRVGGGT